MNSFLKLLIAKRCIPMQKCPICDGTGKVTDEYFNKNICPTCKGERIIPMHYVDTPKHDGKIKKTLL